MKLAYIPFVLRRVTRNMKDVLWTHMLTSGTMAMALLIFGGFLLVQQNLQGLLKSWGNQIQMFAYLEETLTSQQLKGLLAQVRALPEVDSIRYVSQEKAWHEFRRSLGAQSGLLDGLESDIVPASLEIAVKSEHRGRETLRHVAERLRRTPGIAEVEYPAEWMERLNVLLLGVQWTKWILGGLLFIATLFIVGNTVKLAILARHEEIEIMQLVGATGGLIKAPFILEGMIQGVFGALLSVVLLGLLFLFAGAQLPATLGSLLPADELHFLDLKSVALLLGMGWTLGACGSLFAVRRFLNI
ncbi:MAG: permease-like cell division protein FtsX [Candidatus Binatia bacterium]